MRLAGRVALVTGGGTGLGRAISLALSESGAAVAVNWSRSGDAAEETVEAIRGQGGRAVAVRADVTDGAAVDAMLDAVVTELGPLSILVNNAGTTMYAPFPDIDAVRDDDWARILDVNVVGAYRCVRAARRAMPAGGGKVLNVASNSAFTAAGSSIPYVVSKSALVSLTQCLARALAPDVQVNAIAPGWMATGWADRHLPADVARGIADGGAGAVAVDDVAAMAVRIVENDGMTGEVVVVDRGEIWLERGDVG